VASLSQGRTAAAQCGLFTYKSVPVIFEPPCTSHFLAHAPSRHVHIHTTTAHSISGLSGPQTQADLSNRTKNRILLHVIPTHYPHDIQYALNKPILHKIHNTHKTLILPNLLITFSIFTAPSTIGSNHLYKS